MSFSKITCWIINRVKFVLPLKFSGFRVIFFCFVSDDEWFDDNDGDAS